MASSTKKQKVQDSKCSREFQTWWAEKYGMINKGNKAVCVFCSGSVVSRTSSVKRHFETNHKSFCEKSESEQKELIASAIKDRNKQSTSMFKYLSKNCRTIAASYSAANAIARHAVFARYCIGNIIKEELIAITLLLTTTKSTDICTATLAWPARSPDLSPVKHVCDQLKRQMPSCQSVHDLELAVRDLWAHLPQDNIRCLINSLPDRVVACIAAGGGPTRY
ncbi:general transcription factor II-I repeat domain-containing protein 2A [Trichonephila clavipes]|nr:general transcription factor II-I repeat domain-containing protein 2A [Trichonephila clavipes]